MEILGTIFVLFIYLIVIVAAVAFMLLGLCYIVIGYWTTVESRASWFKGAEWHEDYVEYALKSVSFYKIIAMPEVFLLLGIYKGVSKFCIFMYSLPIVKKSCGFIVNVVKSTCNSIESSALKLHEFMKKERKLPKIKIELELE